MKLTKNQLRQVILEEMTGVLQEQGLLNELFGYDIPGVSWEGAKSLAGGYGRTIAGLPFALPGAAVGLARGMVDQYIPGMEDKTALEGTKWGAELATRPAAAAFRAPIAAAQELDRAIFEPGLETGYFGGGPMDAPPLEYPDDPPYIPDYEWEIDDVGPDDPTPAPIETPEDEIETLPDEDVPGETLPPTAGQDEMSFYGPGARRRARQAYMRGDLPGQTPGLDYGVGLGPRGRTFRKAAKDARRRARGARLMGTERPDPTGLAQGRERMRYQRQLQEFRNRVRNRIKELYR